MAPFRNYTTPQEIAVELEVNVSTVYDWIHKQWLPVDAIERVMSNHPNSDKIVRYYITIETFTWFKREVKLHERDLQRFIPRLLNAPKRKGPSVG